MAGAAMFFGGRRRPCKNMAPWAMFFGGLVFRCCRCCRQRCCRCCIMAQSLALPNSDTGTPLACLITAKVETAVAVGAQGARGGAIRITPHGTLTLCAGDAEVLAIRWKTVPWSRTAQNTEAAWAARYGVGPATTQAMSRATALSGGSGGIMAKGAVGALKTAVAVRAQGAAAALGSQRRQQQQWRSGRWRCQRRQQQQRCPTSTPSSRGRGHQRRQQSFTTPLPCSRRR